MPFDIADFTELMISTREKRDPGDLINLVLKGHPSTELFLGLAKSINGGESYRFDVINAEHTIGGWVADSHGTHSTAIAGDLLGTGQYDFVTHVTPVHLDFTVLEKNQGPERLIDLADIHLEAAIQKAKKDIATALHTSAGVANAIPSWDALINDTDPIGGIDPATATYWKSVVNVVDSDLVNVRRAVDDTLLDIKANGGLPPTDFICGRTLFSAYQDYVGEKVHYVGGASNGTADVAWETFKHGGLTVSYDQDCDDEVGYFIHKPSLLVGYLNDNLLKVTTPYQLAGTLETVTPIVSMLTLGVKNRQNFAKLTYTATPVIP